MNKTHYVYKIINNDPTDQRKYYIGVRSTHHQDPNNDTNYRSSSKHLKQALREIGHKNFSKEVLSVWETRELANDEEIRLHELYDVARNPEYYNKAKAHSKRFCTEGMTTVKNILTGENEFVTVEEARDKSKYQPLYFDTVNAIDTVTGQKVKVTKDEYKNNPNLRHTVKGTITAVDLETGIRRQVTVEEFNNNPNLVGQQIGRVNVLDTRNGKRYSVSKEDFDKYDYYEQVTKGTMTVFDISDGLTKKVTIADYKNNSNYKHLSSKVIHIFDDNDNLRHTSYGNFDDICKNNALPKLALIVSYRNNGKPLYQNVGSNTSRLERSGYLKFKGWYAREITLSMEYQECDNVEEIGISETQHTRDEQKTEINKTKYKNNPNSQYSVRVLDTNTNEIKLVSTADYQNNENYVSIKSKCVGIFDELGNLQFKSYDNFKKFCVERKMPYNAFAKSLQQNGKPLYENVYSNQSRLEKAGYWKFKGWYAKELS